MKTEYLSFPQHPAGVHVLLRRAKQCPHVTRGSAIRASDENMSSTALQMKEIRVESLLVPGWSEIEALLRRGNRDQETKALPAESVLPFDETDACRVSRRPVLEVLL
jgi:hypothetical protein